MLKKFQIFNQNYGLTPRENSKFVPLWNRRSFCLEGKFSIQNVTKHFLSAYIA